ncbi:hypothetical protein C3B47_08035 [Flavobacterium columnare]|uniref:hypothetical protein n=1 Tax=Flavobacterium columnare TaxID=996 RepID=UPI00189690C1|nr:hypothetical protein [Flavobacterium columnare]MBF6652843.1 hypothetical protein [Flavobacterium columnare]
MRKFIILISIIIFSCSQKTNEIERIEIMSYYYNLNDSQTEFKTEPVTYSIIDENGNVETIQKTPFSKNKYLQFKSTVDRKIIDKISLNSKNKSEKFYNEKPKNSIVEISCGPIIRIKIKYKNQKETTFNFSDFKTNSKHKDFIELQNLIKNNYAEKKFNKIENSAELEKKLKAFEKYSMNKDTLELPFPPMPMPNKNPIKFTK